MVLEFIIACKQQTCVWTCFRRQRSGLCIISELQRSSFVEWFTSSYRPWSHTRLILMDLQSACVTSVQSFPWWLYWQYLQVSFRSAECQMTSNQLQQEKGTVFFFLTFLTAIFSALMTLFDWTPDQVCSTLHHNLTAYYKLLRNTYSY